MRESARSRASSTRAKPARDNADPRAGAAQQYDGANRAVAATPTLHEGCDNNAAPLVTRRTWRKIKHRESVFMPAPSAVGALLAGLGDDVRRVFMVGPKPGAGTAGGLRSWAFDDLPAGWSHGAGGHHMESSTPVLEYRRPDGASVSVLRAASWFGEGDYSPAEARAAYDAVRALIETRFFGATLLATPATTGRQLFVQEIPKDHEYPVLSRELQELVRDTAGQHRYDPSDDELGARGGELDELHEYDARFQYAALAWGLAVGAPARDTRNEFLGHARARYCVTFTVPRTWSHLGILPVKEAGSRWRYPREPGARYTTWVDGCELAIALRHAWECTIHERIIWRTGKPLDKWANKLVDARQSVRGTDRVSGLVRGALRQTVLAAIGAFHGTPRAQTKEAPIAGPRPRGELVENLRAEGDHWVWTERDPDAGWSELRHPEWSAAIWARSRCRLLDAPTARAGVRAGAFSVPAGDVFALRADAIYLSARADWPDDGKPGRFRLVRSVTKRQPAPSSHAALLEAREQ